jgi:hypothetical protein
MKMIKKALVFTGLFLIGFNYLFAQEVPQPDFANVPAYYIEGTNELHNLAKENVTMVGKPGKAMYELQGVISKVRIKQTDNYILIIKAGDFDPSTMMQLKKATITKKNRQIPMAQAQGFFKVSVDTSKDAIPYNLKKLDNNVFQIIPESQLESGEYVIMVGPTGYSFGIE